jgi:hypothetical protein
MTYSSPPNNVAEADDLSIFSVRMLSVRGLLLFHRLKGESFRRQGVQMIRQIPRGLSHLADAARRSWRSLNPPTATLLFYEVTLAVPDATNREPIFVSYANHRHMGNLP